MPDYGAIIRRSIEVVKKNKWLWVFGALVGGSSFGGFNYARDLPFSNQKDTPIPQSIPEKTAQVLSATSSAISAWISTLSPFTLIILGLGIILLIVMAISVGFIVSAWAKAALITGSDMALEDKEVNLSAISPKAIAKIKHLITFSLIIFTIYILYFSVLPGAWFLIYLPLRNITLLKALWVMVGLTLGTFTFILTIVFTIMASIYAERLIVLKNVAPWEATKKALSISRNSFLATAVMGVVNTASSAVFGCLTTLALLIVLGIPAIVLLYPSLTYKQFPSPVTIIFLLLLVLIFIVGQMLIRAVLAVFTYTNWNQMFEEVLAKEPSKNSKNEL